MHSLLLAEVADKNKFSWFILFCFFFSIGVVNSLHVSSREEHIPRNHSHWIPTANYCFFSPLLLGCFQKTTLLHMNHLPNTSSFLMH